MINFDKIKSKIAKIPKILTLKLKPSSGLKNLLKTDCIIITKAKVVIIEAVFGLKVQAKLKIPAKMKLKNIGTRR